MNYYNSETLLEQQAEIEKLKEQNAALAAQVIILTRKIFATYHNQINVSTDNKLGVMDVFNDVGELFELAKTTPQQHLAEIRAEAVKNEFDSILHSVANQFTANDTTNPWHNGANHVFVLFAKEIDKRVKSIRQGEV